jgi:hypothetical protein
VLKIASAFSAKILLSGKLFGEAFAIIGRVFSPFFCYFSTKKFFKKFFSLKKTKFIKICPFFPQNQKIFPLAKNLFYLYFYH